jgi:hypothetical protein
MLLDLVPITRCQDPPVCRATIKRRMSTRLSAALRHAAAAAAGRTYNEQLEFEVAQGSTIALGLRQNPNVVRSGRVPAAGTPVAAVPDDSSDDVDVIVAGLVGTGGGGHTPLVFAARGGDQESAKALVDAGADVNQTTEYGWTPLLTATNNRHYQLARYLIERGGKPNVANKGGWTPPTSPPTTAHRRRRLSSAELRHGPLELSRSCSSTMT